MTGTHNLPEGTPSTITANNARNPPLPDETRPGTTPENQQRTNEDEVIELEK